MGYINDFLFALGYFIYSDLKKYVYRSLPMYNETL